MSNISNHEFEDKDILMAYGLGSIEIAIDTESADSIILSEEDVMAMVEHFKWWREKTETIN